MAVDAASAPVDVLLLGASGQLGRELLRSLAGSGTIAAPTRAEADLAAADSLRKIVARHRPRIVVNAAAYTAVDRAESEPDIARSINAVAPGVLAEACAAIGAAFVHYSTDYVFDGAKDTCYDEGDAANPLSVYGRTKLDGEIAAQRACPRHLIFRTSWVFAPHGANFLRTILRLAAERDRLRIVADQVGAPTSVADIAAATLRALAALRAAPESDPRWSLYHLAAAGETTWFDYARYVVRKARELGATLRADEADVVPITTAEYGAAARRPASSRLSTAKLRSVFGIEPRSWSEGVDECLNALLSARSA